MIISGSIAVITSSRLHDEAITINTLKIKNLNLFIYLFEALYCLRKSTPNAPPRRRRRSMQGSSYRSFQSGPQMPRS